MEEGRGAVVTTLHHLPLESSSSPRGNVAATGVAETAVDVCNINNKQQGAHEKNNSNNINTALYPCVNHYFIF